MPDLSWILDYSWLIVVAPLVSFVLCISIGRYLWEGGAVLCIGSIGFSFVLSILLLTYVLLNGALGGNFQPVDKTWYTWIGSEEMGRVIVFGLLVDNLSAFMLALVSFLSLLIAIYSIGYMGAEEGKPRYYAEISLFVSGMLGTVSADNYLQLLIFWETMGLCSYLLIGFWYKKPEAASAAKKAFIVTRVGDVMFLAGIVILFILFNTFNLMEIQERAAEIPVHLVSVVPLLIFGGAVGKSAQFPLHAWLPDAMEGPTTVSALIHAATMVKGGVYLAARAIPLMIPSPQILLFVAIIGGFTAFFTATMALANYDIKRVLAFSTMSQLGYMFLALGTAGYALSTGLERGAEGYSAGIFHLMNHAFFKALMFLSAGSVIHAMHTNDMRLMGGLHDRMRITSWAMLTGSLAIAGIPPLSGFWSKDEILAAVFGVGEQSSVFLLLWVLGIATAFMTAFYMFRMWFVTFKGRPRWKHEPHESPPVMTIPLAILSVFTVVSGLFIFPLQGFGNLIFLEHAEPKSTWSIVSSTFFGLESFVTYTSLLVSLGGIGLAAAIYYRQSISPSFFTATGARRLLHTMLTKRYWIDDAYNAFGLRVVYGFARLSDLFDRYVIDGAVNGIAKLTVLFARSLDIFDRKGIDGVVNGISLSTVRSGWSLRTRQTGHVQTYAAVIVVGVALFLFLELIVRRILGM